MADPLDYAIDDQPLPEEQQDDPEFARSYAEARADLDLIREGLGAVAEHTPPPRRGITRAPRMRVLLAAAACLAVLSGGGLWASTVLDQSTETAASAPDDYAQSKAQDSEGGALENGRSAAVVRCARLVVRGTVTEVRESTVRVAVAEQLRPDDSNPPHTRTFEVERSAGWRVGHDVLVLVPSDDIAPPTVVWLDENPVKAQELSRQAALARPPSCPR